MPRLCLLLLSSHEKRKIQINQGYIEEIQDDVRDHLMKTGRGILEIWTSGGRISQYQQWVLHSISSQNGFRNQGYTGEMQIKDVLELVQESRRPIRS